MFSQFYSLINIETQISDIGLSLKELDEKLKRYSIIKSTPFLVIYIIRFLKVKSISILTFLIGLLKNYIVIICFDNVFL